MKKKFCIAAFVKSPKDDDEVPSSSQKEPKVQKEKVASKSPAFTPSSIKHSSNPKKHSEETKSEDKYHSSSKSEKKKSKSSSSKDSKEAKVKDVSKVPKEEKKSEHKDRSASKKKIKPSAENAPPKVKNVSTTKEKVKESSKDRGETKHRDEKDSHSEKKVKTSSKSKSTASPSPTIVRKCESPVIKHHDGTSNGFADLPMTVAKSTLSKSTASSAVAKNDSNGIVELSSVKTSAKSRSPIPAKSHDSNGFIELPALGKSLLSESSESNPANSNRNASSVVTNTESSDSRTSELTDLQHKIMLSRERKLIQKVVDLIEETGKYKVHEKTFDFDLCSLDKETLKRLKILVNGS